MYHLEAVMVNVFQVEWVRADFERIVDYLGKKFNDTEIFE